MDFVFVTPENIEKENICCALGATKEARICTSRKKEWMEQQFSKGYHFVKLKENGKVFIEYTPAPNAWAPIKAENWLFLDCFWVSGKFKGQGISNQLLDFAIAYANDNKMIGICAVSSNKKKPFLSDPDYLKYKGFIVADTAPPYYELLALPLQENKVLPQFNNCVKKPTATQAGFSVFYTDHCPHTTRYVEIIKEIAEKEGFAFTAHKLLNKEQAQNVPNPFTTYALYYDGDLIGNEIFSASKMQKFINQIKTK